MGNSLVCWLTINNTFGNRPLPATSTHTNTVNNISLFGLVPQTASLVRTSRPGETNNGGLLTILPAPHTLHKPHHIGLLLAP